MGNEAETKDTWVVLLVHLLDGSSTDLYDGSTLEQARRKYEELVQWLDFAKSARICYCLLFLAQRLAVTEMDIFNETWNRNLRGTVIPTIVGRAKIVQHGVD